MLEINNNMVRKNSRYLKLNHILLNNLCITEEIKNEIRKYLSWNNVNATYPNLWDAAKAVLKGNFIAFHDYVKKERSKKSNRGSSILINLFNVFILSTYLLGEQYWAKQTCFLPPGGHSLLREKDDK